MKEVQARVEGANAARRRNFFAEEAFIDERAIAVVDFCCRSAERTLIDFQPQVLRA